MTEPLGVTASVIAVATLALQSCKAAYNLIDGLKEAPQAIARSKNSLAETEKTTEALRKTLTANIGPSSGLNSTLATIDLDGTLRSVDRLCNEFATTITGFAGHSTNDRFSKRDRIVVSLHESKIRNLNRQLGYCQQTLSMVLVSINLIVTTQTSDDLRRLDGRFQAQEQALANLDTQLCSYQNPPPLEKESACDQDMGLELITELRKVCQDTLSTTKAKRTGQKFSEMNTDDQSMAMQGVAGDAHGALEQSFGKMTTSKNSRAFQGQMDAASFAVMFGKR